MSIPHVLRNVTASRIMNLEANIETNQHQRLREARQKIYSSAAEAARAIGVGPSTYTHHENGTRSYGELEARKYARRFKTTPEFLLLGIKAPTKSIVREIDARAGAGGGGLPIEINQSGGDGRIVTTEAIRDIWQIPDSFLRGELHMEANTAWIVEVFGDSGYDPSDPHTPGSIMPGDRVIIDARDKSPSPPGLFAVYDGIGLVLKLVEVVPKSDPISLKLSSRNPSYSPYEVTLDEARIIGRVRGRISEI